MCDSPTISKFLEDQGNAWKKKQKIAVKND